MTRVVRPARLSCRWPTAGTTGPTCGAATYAGIAVTLPTDEIGIHHG